MKYSHLLIGLTTLLMLGACSAKHYQLTGVERTRIIIDSRYDQSPDEAAASFLAPYKHVNDSIMGPVVGQVARNMHARRPESALSNLLADILVWAAADYGEKPDLAVYNMGGIRADLTKGPVTYGHVLDMAPFENKICFVTLTGEQLMRLFQQMVYRRGEAVSHGVRLVAKRDASGGHADLLSASLHGQPIDPAAKYRVATIDYVLEGNDGMSAFCEGTDIVAPKEAANNVRYLIMNYFRDKAARGEIVDSEVEGRITIQK